MANFFQSLFAAIKEPFPSIVCNCLLDAYVHPSLSFGKTDSPDRTHIEVKFKDSEWAPNEIVDSFFIYQDDLQRLVPSGDFVFSIQNHHAVPSFRDIVWEKYRTFLSRWTRHRKKVSRRWKSGRLQKISSAE
jgi:hypothetical protein